MPDQAVEQQEQKPVKRFATYEEFLKEFYPKSSEQQALQQTENNEEFGIELGWIPYVQGLHNLGRFC